MADIETEHKELKLVSTGPVCDEKQYGVYVDILDQKIQDTDVFNIGIIAPYGAGKSSLIKTYKETKLSPRQCKRVTTISLANFNSNSDKLVKDKEGRGKNVAIENTVGEVSSENDLESKIEKSILEQIIFKESKVKLPNSRLKRIDNRHCWMSLLIALMLTATIALTCCGILECMQKLPFSNGDNFYYYFGFAVGCILVFLFILLYNNKLNKISVKDIEVDMGENTTYSVLNTFIDEILYYFRATKTNIVIIEDLDRFDNTQIFSKLRELNFLINNSRIVKQKVTFVYAVKDTLFKTEKDRAKFFDYILSLVPVLSFTNAREILDGEMNKCCSKDMLLPQTYIYEVSHFIEEMRILKNVINDYVTYYNILKVDKYNNEDKNTKLFSLALYKNLRPADFAELQFDKGELAFLFETKKTKLDEKIKEIKDRIKELEKQLALANELKLNSFSIFKSFIKGMIIDHNQSRNYNTSYIDISNVRSFREVGKGLSAHIYNYNEVYCTVEYLEKQLGDTLVNFEEKINQKVTLDVNKINMELSESRNKIRLLLNYSMQELIKEDEFFVQDELLSYFLSNGYIAEDYKEYVAHSDQDLLSERDKAFVRTVLSKRTTEYGYKLDNSLNVIREISTERFLDKYVLNFDLVQSLLSYNDHKQEMLDKKENLIKFLSSRDSLAM